MPALRHRVPEARPFERHPRTPPQVRRALRALWREVEPFLTEEERASLGGGAFENVFPLGADPEP